MWGREEWCRVSGVGNVQGQAEFLKLVVFGQGIEGFADPGHAAVIELGIEDAKAKAQGAKAAAMIEIDGLLWSVT